MPQVGLGRQLTDKGEGIGMKRKPIPADAKRPEPVSVHEIRRAQGSPRLMRVLLRVCQERLARAVELERDCNLPLAETSVIVHDVAKLSRALDAPTEEQDRDPAGKSPQTVEDLLDF